MKQLVALLLCTIFSFYTHAQGESAITKGQKQLNFGLPGYLGFDFCIHDLVTIGPKGVYELFSDNNTIKAGVVSDFHFNKLLGIPNNWDVYAGVSAGWRFKTDKNNGSEGFDIGGQIGGRWFWSEKWGLNLEGGFSGSIGGGLGLTMRM